MTDKIKDIDFINGDDRGINLIPEFLRNGTIEKAIVNAKQEEIQELYEALKDLFNNTLLAVAYGVTLDQYGERVNLAREQGQKDDDYRTAIQAQIRSTSGHGSIIDMIDLMNVLCQTDTSVLQEVFPAHFFVSAVTDDPSGLSTADIYNKMLQARASGVGVDVGVQAETNPFLFSDSEEGGPNNTGFATVADGSDGGKFNLMFPYDYDLETQPDGIPIEEYTADNLTGNYSVLTDAGIELL